MISKSLRPVFIDYEMTQNLFQLSAGCQLLPGYKYQYCKQSIKQSKVKVNKKVCPLLPTPIKCHLVVTHQIIIMITRGMILWTLMIFPVLSRVMLYPWYQKLLQTLMLPVPKMTMTMTPVLPIIVYRWMMPRTARPLSSNCSDSSDSSNSLEDFHEEMQPRNVHQRNSQDHEDFQWDSLECGQRETLCIECKFNRFIKVKTKVKHLRQLRRSISEIIKIMQ